ncbi:MAG: tetratricopeptide repeat protein [Treponema sp.]|jgi:tetratricopeptide (TPR) repeat protein|nr:tetratricopeptide repeat protein [Treponema sp.]
MFFDQEAVKYRTSGDEYRNKGDYDRAMADYSEALRIDLNDAVAKNNLRTPDSAGKRGFCPLGECSGVGVALVSGTAAAGMTLLLNPLKSRFI